METAETYTTEQQTTTRTLPPLKIEIDISKLELGDILLLDDVAAGKPYNLTEVVRMLDRVVEGGFAGRPINQYRPLLGQMLAIVHEIANPK